MSLITVNAGDCLCKDPYFHGMLWQLSNTLYAIQVGATNVAQWTQNRVASQQKTSSEIWAMWYEIKGPLTFCIVACLTWVVAKLHKPKGNRK